MCVPVTYYCVVTSMLVSAAGFRNVRWSSGRSCWGRHGGAAVGWAGTPAQVRNGFMTVTARGCSGAAATTNGRAKLPAHPAYWRPVQAPGSHVTALHGRLPLSPPGHMQPATHATLSTRHHRQLSSDSTLPAAHVCSTQLLTHNHSPVRCMGLKASPLHKEAMGFSRGSITLAPSTDTPIVSPWCGRAGQW